MRWGGRIAAAIDILGEVLDRHRPASAALKEWGRAHRFAGSGDRHAIGTLVFDVLRRRNALAFAMEDASPRALVLAALHDLWKKPVDEIALWTDEIHGPGALSADERSLLDRPRAASAPLHVAGNIPEWLVSSFERAFGARAAEEGAGLAERAPVDLRVNTLKADRTKLITALAKYGASEGPLSPWCVRIAPPGPDARNPNVEAEPAHGKGWFEIQDAGSQVAALMSGVKPGEQVADICAGAGGKTLALAAMMANKGQIHAHDADKHRLRPIFERLQRAGARNVQVIGADEIARLQALHSKMDCVLVDAPCSGSGSWRRKPDAKWRLTERQLTVRLAEQRTVLAEAALLVKPGGRIVYITCSILPEENGAQVQAFLTSHPEFACIPYAEQWQTAMNSPVPESADGSSETLLLTPARHATDGFFIAIIRRAT
jgi:16S rRNA (cytosine967-C5)-methyltransferase